MLFMGEEWGASTPFQFFSSHPEAELARATAEGRKAEFAEHGWDGCNVPDIPDPQDPQTFQRSKLNWDEPGSGGHVRLHRLYRDLIALRHNEPDLLDPWLEHLVIDYDEDRHWIMMRRRRVVIACNLGTETTTVPVTGELVLAWDAPTVGSETTELPAHSFAILRLLREQS
jgi:maltooligosyltrehalose trehalohydrolase